MIKVQAVPKHFQFLALLLRASFQ